MKFAICCAAALTVAAPACAQDVTLKPLLEARLRGEIVDQAGIAAEAQAVTLRARAGITATTGVLTATVEAQATAALDGDYYDGLHGVQTRPQVSDPQNIALYLANFQYHTKPLTVTLGRQKIALDDERFVGNAGFRDNAQTFDAVRVEMTVLPKLKADISYAWDVRTIWGIDGNGARPQSINGNNILANLSYASPIGTLTAFAYVVDQDKAAVQGFKLSSQSYGARLAGVRPVGPVKLSYQASYARQSNYNRNPNIYHADYYLIDAAGEYAGFKAGAGYEVLGASTGAALTSFQTPLATGFKFQGWADKFLTTPPDGVRDLYGNVGWSAKAVGPLKAVTLQAIYHRFDSDRLVRHYGDELDLLASAKVGRYTFSLRYADYWADLFATNTRKGWAQVDWAF